MWHCGICLQQGAEQSLTRQAGLCCWHRCYKAHSCPARPWLCSHFIGMLHIFSWFAKWARTLLCERCCGSSYTFCLTSSELVPNKWEKREQSQKFHKRWKRIWDKATRSLNWELHWRRAVVSLPVPRNKARSSRKLHVSHTWLLSGEKS